MTRTRRPRRLRASSSSSARPSAPASTPAQRRAHAVDRQADVEPEEVLALDLLRRRPHSSRAWPFQSCTCCSRSSDDDRQPDLVRIVSRNALTSLSSSVRWRSSSFIVSSSSFVDWSSSFIVSSSSFVDWSSSLVVSSSSFVDWSSSLVVSSSSTVDCSSS